MSRRIFPIVVTNPKNNNYIRKFVLDNNCYYIEEVTYNDFTVVHTEYSNGLGLDNDDFSKYKGYHKIGDRLKGGIYEELIDKSSSKSLEELVNEQANQIEVDSNSELLGEIFGDVAYNTSSNSDFSVSDVYMAQIVGRVSKLEEALKRLLGVIEAMNQHMEKLESNNQNLTSLVTQVLNHQVPDELAINVLEDIFNSEE